MSIRNLFHPSRRRAGPVTLATAALAAALAVVALLAAGCGGSKSSSKGVASVGGSGGNAVTSTTKANQEQVLLQFTQCMRKNGVNMADPTVDANGNVRLSPPVAGSGGSQPSQAALTKATSACQKYLQGVTQGFSSQNQSQFRDSVLKYTQCMRKNGYEMPDPDFSGGAAGLFGGGKINQNDPAYKKADAVCHSNLAQLGNIGGGK